MLQIITIICVTYVQKNFSIRALIKQLLTKYQNFTKLPQIPHIHINRIFLDQLLHPYKFHGRDMSGILFFNFASCEPLNSKGLKFCIFSSRKTKFPYASGCCPLQTPPAASTPPSFSYSIKSYHLGLHWYFSYICIFMIGMHRRIEKRNCIPCMHMLLIHHLNL